MKNATSPERKKSEKWNNEIENIEIPLTSVKKFR